VLVALGQQFQALRNLDIDQQDFAELEGDLVQELGQNRE
jgi:hypothetical protein